MQTYLNQYFDLVTSFQIKNEKIRWIYQSAYNYMCGAYILAQNGLKNQAHNSARMALEFHWMGLLLAEDKILLRSWCLGIGDKKKIKMKYRQEIYQVLSDTSHAKFKNICFMDDGNKHYGRILGGFQSDYDVRQYTNAIDLYMKFVLSEDSEHYDVADVSEYSRNELHSISGFLGIDRDGAVHPHVTSKRHVSSDIANAIAMLEMAKNPEEFLK